MIDYCWWLQEHVDRRPYFAVIYEVLLRICKKSNAYIAKEPTCDDKPLEVATAYKPVDYLQLKWCIDRINFQLMKDHGIYAVPVELLNWYEDSVFVPERFDIDWTDKYADSYKDFISGAEMRAIIKITQRYKIYGRAWLYITTRLWLLKYELKRKLKQKQVG